MEFPSESNNHIANFGISWTLYILKIHVIRLTYQQQSLSGVVSLLRDLFCPMSRQKPQCREVRDPCGFSQIAHDFEPQLHQHNWDQNSWLGELTRIKHSESRLFEFRIFELKWKMEKHKFFFFLFSLWNPTETIPKCVKTKKKHVSTTIKKTGK